MYEEQLVDFALSTKHNYMVTVQDVCKVCVWNIFTNQLVAELSEFLLNRGVTNVYLSPNENEMILITRIGILATYDVTTLSLKHYVITDYEKTTSLFCYLGNDQLVMASNNSDNLVVWTRTKSDTWVPVNRISLPTIIGNETIAKYNEQLRHFAYMTIINGIIYIMDVAT